jgi:hypothetical protein
VAARKNKKSKFAHDADGRRLAWARPAKPEVALRLANRSLVMNDPRLFGANALPENEAGPYTFVGWVSANGMSALDDDGVFVDNPAAGDSIISFEEEEAS